MLRDAAVGVIIFMRRHGISVASRGNVSVGLLFSMKTDENNGRVAGGRTWVLN